MVQRCVFSQDFVFVLHIIIILRANIRLHKSVLESAQPAEAFMPLPVLTGSPHPTGMGANFMTSSESISPLQAAKTRILGGFPSLALGCLHCCGLHCRPRRMELQHALTAHPAAPPASASCRALPLCSHVPLNLMAAG